jgi:diguanylate cyclase (GGDEF)-like protein
VRRDSRSAAELVTQIIRHGLEAYLGSTRTYVVLVDGKGSVVSANPAFQAAWPDRSGPIAIRELIVPSLRQYAESLFQSAHRDHMLTRGILEFGSEKEAIRCEVLLIPLERGGSLIFAEPVRESADLVSVKEKLEAELMAVKSALAAKTVELRAVIAQADEMAHTDALTFLPNRRMIVGDLQRQVHYAERYGTHLTISMLDLDDFKAVNDQLGHAAGDQVLAAVSRELRERVRQPDEIGRYGGDELLVILPNSTSAAASEQAARLCQWIRELTIPVDGHQVRLTLSIGVAQMKAHGDSWESLLDRADRALYEAKRGGGDRWVIMES